MKQSPHAKWTAEPERPLPNPPRPTLSFMVWAAQEKEKEGYAIVVVGVGYDGHGNGGKLQSLPDCSQLLVPQDPTAWQFPKGSARFSLKTFRDLCCCFFLCGLLLSPGLLWCLAVQKDQLEARFRALPWAGSWVWLGWGKRQTF